MNYKAVLFDLDGTLLDTLDDLADSANAVLESRGLPPHPAEAYKIFVGNGVENLVRRAVPAQNRDDDHTVAQLVVEMREEYHRRWHIKTRAYDGVDEMLRAVAENGLKQAVLSNKPHDFTKLCVERFLGDHCFQVVQGVGDGFPPKPDPTGAERVSEILAVPPERFLYLGDTNTDMQTANAAGMYAVGATWGFRTAEELTQNGAKTLINHPSELLDLL